MPITQARFMEILDVAELILSEKRFTAQLLSESMPFVASANSYLDRCDDPNAKAIINGLLATVNQLQDFNSTTILAAMELYAKVSAEKAHFKSVRAKNDRASARQREWRHRQGMEVRTPTENYSVQSYSKPPESHETQVYAPDPRTFRLTPELQAYLNGSQALEPEPKPAQPPVMARAHPSDVVSSSVPDLTELNRTPTPDDDVI